MRKIVSFLLSISLTLVLGAQKESLIEMVLLSTQNICVGGEIKLEDLKVLRRSPDLLNNVKIGQGQLQLKMEQILFFTIYILVK